MGTSKTFSQSFALSPISHPILLKMLASTPRAAARSTRALRFRQPVPVRPRQPRNARFQSTNTSNASSSSSSPASSGALMGGLAGGATALLVGYTWYHFSGAKSVVNSVHQAKSYVNSAFKKTTESAPEPNQAVEWLRDTVKSYTKMIPGASKYVDSAFEDLEKIRQKHGEEVDQIIKETYNELKGVTNKGFSVEAVSQAWDVIQKCFSRISSLAVDASQDILNNHPQLKEKLGGNFEQLQKMGEQYGPEAKEKVEETYNQVRDILKGGLGQLWQKLQEAAKSGNTDDVQNFVKEQVNNLSQKAGGGGIEQYLQMIPGGSEIASKLQQLQELSQKHGQEAEKLAKSAMEDIKKVLSQKVEEGKKLKEKAEADAKK